MHSGGSLRQPCAGRGLVVLIALFVVTAQWSGVTLGPLQLSDYALVAILAVAALGPRRTAAAWPAGVVVLLAAVTAATAITTLAPPSPTWLTMRFTGFGAGAATHSGLGDAGLGSWAFVLKLALATAGGWVALRQLDSARPGEAAAIIARAWIVGAVVSAAVAFAEWRAGLDLSAYLAQPVESARASGLAFHPNSLALYTAAAIPLTAVLLRRARTVLPAVTAIAILWAGVVASDSRVGLAAAAVGTLALPVLTGQAGRVAIVISTAVLPAAPLALAGAIWLQGNTRLSAGAASDSDAGRHLIYEQAWLDFQHSPIWGIGFENGGGAPFAPMAVLAGGGLIAAVGFVAFLGWAYGAVLPHRADLDVRALLMSATAVLVVVLAQNNVTDRGQYVPLLGAVIAAWRLRVGAGTERIPADQSWRVAASQRLLPSSAR